MTITAVELYERLREKLGADEASMLVRYIEEAVERRAATKEDLLETEHTLETTVGGARRDLGEQIDAVRHDLEEQIDAVRHDLEEQIDAVRHDLEEQIGAVRRELGERVTRLEERMTSLEERMTSLEERMTNVEERIGNVEKELLEIRHALERRMDRFFYALLAAMIILNGDKVVAFLNALLALVR